MGAIKLDGMMSGSAPNTLPGHSPFVILGVLPVNCIEPLMEAPDTLKLLYITFSLVGHKLKSPRFLGMLALSNTIDRLLGHPPLSLN